jgi:hypothetical protein
MYLPSYHAACKHLVAFGAWRYRIRGRRLITAALRDLRRRDRERARYERRSLLFISGMFPAKHTDPRYAGQTWAQPEPEDQ